MARPAQTLILITRHTVVRADYRRGAVAFGEWSQPRPELPDLASVVEYALSLGPRPGRAVWVLSTDLWTQTLALPVAKVAGLKADDLDQALGFEAESYSGIPSYESAIGSIAFPPARGERMCWLTQVRMAEREAVVEAVTRAGGSLAGMLHPGGLPQRLHRDDPGPFERLELWPDAVIGLRREVDGTWQTRVWNSDPPLNRWQADAATWLRANPISEEAETLTADGLAEPHDRLAPVVALDDANRLKQWLAAWAARLASRDRGVPVIPPPVRAMSVPARAMVAVALMLFVAALGAVHGFAMQRQVDDLNATFAQEKTALKNAEDFNKMVEGKFAEREKLRVERTKLEKENERLAKELGGLMADRAKVDAELESRRTEREQAKSRLRLEREKAAAGHVQDQELRSKDHERVRGQHAEEIQRHRERFGRLLQELAKQKPDDLVIQKIEQAGNTLTISGLALMPNHPDRFATDLAPLLRSCGWSVQPAKTVINKVDDTELHAFSIAIVDMAKLPEVSDTPRVEESRP